MELAPFLRRTVPLLLPVLCAGCLRIEETMTLESDGSGSVRVQVEFPQPAMRYLPGTPNRDWVQSNLPDGVRLTSFTNEQIQTTITDGNGKEHNLAGERYQCDVAFSKAAALNDIRVWPDARNATAAAAGSTPGKEMAAATPGSDVPQVGPFQKLTLVEDGELLHFHRVVQAARDRSEAEMMSSPASESLPQSIDLRNSVLKITIICPGEATEHNAHHVEGRKLMWEFNLKELQERQDRDWIVKFTCRREAES